VCEYLVRVNGADVRRALQLERVAVFPDVILVLRLDALLGHVGLVARLPAR